MDMSVSTKVTQPQLYNDDFDRKEACSQGQKRMLCLTAQFAINIGIYWMSTYAGAFAANSGTCQRYPDLSFCKGAKMNVAGGLVVGVVMLIFLNVVVTAVSWRF